MSLPPRRSPRPVEGLTLGELVMEMYWNYQDAIERGDLAETPLWQQQLRERSRLERLEAQQRKASAALTA